MDAREFKVVDVLSRNERFIVPLYQRQYQWHDHRRYEGRTSAFWLDVAAKASEVLNGGSRRFDHYMGALLLAPEASQRAFGATPAVQVVDGQQRLTTFLILLAAMREVARGQDYQPMITEIEKYLFNEPGRADTDPLAKFKLTPTPVDRAALQDILALPYNEVRKNQILYYRGGSVPQNTSMRTLRAYEYFKAQVEQFVANGVSDDTDVDIDIDIDEANSGSTEAGGDARRRLDALLEALVFHLKLIVITLGPDDDAQVIFETLNSKGQPLLAMDLVRNNIFHRAESQYREVADQDARKKAEDLYNEVWKPFDDGWWRTDAPNARPARPRIDHFLANVLTAETGERITVRELYSEYRAWATPNRSPRFENVEDELSILQRHAPTYEILEGRIQGGDGTIGWLGDRLRLWQNTTAYPIAFQIAADDLDPGERRAIARWIDSYLVRRLLCDLTAKNLNQVMPRLARAIHENGASLETVRSFFINMTLDTTRFPDNTELRASILEKRAYGRIPSRVLSDILWQLELHSRTSKTEKTPKPAQLTVEHVMPQNWTANWPLNGKIVGRFDTEEPGYYERDTALNTLGNLTLVTESLNPALSNAAFATKAPELIRHSNLTLNREIAESDTWDEETIRARGEVLANRAAEVWPSPHS